LVGGAAVKRHRVLEDALQESSIGSPISRAALHGLNVRTPTGMSHFRKENVDEHGKLERSPYSEDDYGSWEQGIASLRIVRRDLLALCGSSKYPRAPAISC
jgi:hypothetical protein